MAEDQGREHAEEHKVQRTEQHAAGPEGVQALESTPSYPAMLPGDPRLDERGNQPVRNAVMRQAQRTYGNRAVQRWLAGQGQGMSQSFGERAVQRWQATHQARPSIQRPADEAAAAGAENIGERIQSKAGGGSSLDEGTRGTLESGLGADMSGVRVHTDGEADQMARSVDSVAFTTGNDIFFQSGAYNPSSSDGLRLLAHEATHTVQQAQGPVAGTPGPGGVSISDPSDSFEQGAERAADSVVSGASASGPAQAQRMPASTSDQNIQRTPVQRQPPGNQPGSAGGASSLIAPDSQAQVGPGQMSKSAFLAEARTAVNDTVSQSLGAIEAVAARPMVDQQFNTYQQLDSQALESTIRQEVPGAAQAVTARDYIPPIRERVRASVSGGGGGAGIMGVLGGAVSGAASAVTSAVGSAISSVASLFFKGNSGGPSEGHDPAAVQSQLGPGHSLDSQVRSGMEGAFGYDFSGVRVHTDGAAAQLSGDMNARAFAVGQNVAFGSGEYQPGTPVGDALIAHELAHVVQQGGSASEAGPQQKGGAEYSSLEEEADTSAVGAVASIWGGAKGGLAGIAPSVMPSLKSGLRLSRCNGGGKTSPGPLKTVTVNVTYLTGGSTSLSTHLAKANEVYKQANVEVKSGAEKTLSESESKAILGNDLILEEFSDPSTPTAEERKLAAENRKAGEITMYYVKAMSAGSIGEAFLSSTGIGAGFVFASPTSRTFPHELGHVLLDDGGHPSDNDNFMAQTSTASGKETMTPAQISTIRGSGYVK